MLNAGQIRPTAENAGASKLNDPKDRAQQLLEGLHRLLKDDSSLTFQDFLEVSNAMLKGYAEFVKKGHPVQSIGLAMLGATVNLYQMFGLENDLKELFRNLADDLDGERPLH